MDTGFHLSAAVTDAAVDVGVQISLELPVLREAKKQAHLVQ